MFRLKFRAAVGWPVLRSAMIRLMIRASMIRSPVPGPMIRTSMIRSVMRRRRRSVVMVIVIVIVVAVVYQNAAAHKKSGGSGNDCGFEKVLHIESSGYKVLRSLNLNCSFVFLPSSYCKNGF